MESFKVVHLNHKNGLMKKTITLSIPKPCKENWDQFANTTSGRHCDQCATIVHDFSEMTDQELIDFIKKGNHNVCGRFRKDQMISYPLAATTQQKETPWLKAGIISLFLAGSAPLMAQSQVKDPQEQTAASIIEENATKTPVFTGKVLCEGEPIPGVNIYSENGEKGTISDLDGNFTLPEGTQVGEKFIVSFIGLESKSFIVPVNTVELQALELDLDYVIMGSLEVIEHEEVSFFRKMKHNIAKIFKS